MAQDSRVAKFIVRNKEIAKNTDEIIKEREPFIVIEAVVQSNYGSRVMADVLRTLYTLDLMSNGGLGTVILAHHIGVYNQLLPAQSHDSSSINCGMINETEDSLRAQMKKRMPEPAEEIEG
ncbi:hypothetical protein ABVK25_000659 [Lepraria finkii]|uniref:Uncharacterized protein n=1 Tax=Lepraria finkii TaxID=1340010 RepID=A0ABR4BNI6_9LECA